MSALIAVVGPTATGKSDLALDLAKTLGGGSAVEIVGADAMQLYRGMDIGTAKLPEGERRGVRHHQIDVLEVTQEASVAAYQREARADIVGIHSRGSLPLVVGGSGLYVRALLDELEFPATDPQVRNDLETQLVALGSSALHARLTEADPAAAGRIDPANGRRIVRALEVIALTGRPYSASLPSYTYHQPTVQIGLRGDIEVLDRRIHKRAHAMFAQGLVEEVRALEVKGLREGKTAARATGYAQALAVLDGIMTVEEAGDEVARATSRLARRQLKWFRRDPRIIWLDFSSPTSLADARRAVEETWDQGKQPGGGLSGWSD